MPSNPITSLRSDTRRELAARLGRESHDGLALAENPQDNPICCLRIDRTVPCVSLVWKGYATSTQLRFVLESVLEMLSEFGLSKVLGDDTALAMINDEDRRWIAEDWMPRAHAAGLRAAASMRPRSYFGRLSLSTLLEQAPRQILLNSFDDLAEAQRWLTEL